MNVLDLFSGIGGFSLGLERAGMRTVGFCEIDPFCRRVLAKHWPHVRCYDDVRTLTAERIAANSASGDIAIDVICGGFPCQDISLAGKGAGLAGERSGLWSEYARIIGEVRPRYIIVENVAALLGRGLGDVLGDLAALGYDAEWHCIPASAVGAPHRRDRVWIIANPGGEQHEGSSPPFSRKIAAEFSQTTLAYTSRGGRRWDWSHVSSEGCAEGWPWASGGGDGESIEIPHPTYHAEISKGIGRGDAAGQWRIEPNLGRVAHGVPSRVDRLRSLGNAVVPQIPEIIGRAIMKHESAPLPRIRKED